MDKTIFRLMGGIGNQLFIYHAAKYYEKLTGFSVAFDLTDIYKNRNNHFGTIRLLNIPREKEITKKSHFTFSNQLLQKIPFSKSFLDETVVFKEIGFSKELLNVPLGSKVQGYFQSYLFTKEIEKSLEKQILSLLENSWASHYFKEMEKEKENIISIHIRRGDYVNLSHSIGLLSENYYSDALRISLENFSGNKVWIFSDDIEIAKKLFKKINVFDLLATYIETPINESPVISLGLMSQSKNLIIANSTFSWWAARLFEDSINKTVFVPNKWFRNMPDPKDLNNRKWVKVDSNWK